MLESNHPTFSPPEINRKVNDLDSILAVSFDAEVGYEKKFTETNVADRV